MSRPECRVCLQDWCQKMTAAAQDGMVRVLIKQPAQGGVGLKVPLVACKPLKISENAQKITKTFKEAWNQTNAYMACQCVGMYEASAPVYWVAVTPATWLGEAVVDAPVSWAKIQEAKTNFDHGAYLASAETANNRRYVFPGVIPTAVVGLPSLEKEVMTGLPVFAGRAVIFGFYCAVADALTAGDDARVVALHEAALTAQIRVRVAPSRTQVIKDCLNWSESVKALAAAGNMSVLDWVAAVASIPTVQTALREKTALTSVQSILKSEGVRLGGKEVSKSAATALAAIYPFADVAALRECWMLCLSVAANMDGITKLMRVCHAVNRRHQSAAAPAMAYVLQAIRADVQSGSVTNAELTEDFLVGAPKAAAPRVKAPAGYVQLLLKR